MQDIPVVCICYSDMLCGFFLLQRTVTLVRVCDHTTDTSVPSFFLRQTCRNTPFPNNGDRGLYFHFLFVSSHLLWLLVDIRDKTNSLSSFPSNPAPIFPELSKQVPGRWRHCHYVPLPRPFFSFPLFPSWFRCISSTLVSFSFFIPPYLSSASVYG